MKHLKKQKLRQSIILALLLLIPSVIQAENDWGAWFKADAKWKQNKWSYNGGLDYRMNDNFTKPQRYSIFGSAGYTPSQLVKLSYVYEFYAHDDGRQNIRIDHRMILQAELYFKWNNFRIINRNSLLDNFTSIEHPSWRIRNRLTLEYPIKKWTPYASVESYLRLTGGFKHQKNRYTAGTKYKLSSNHSLNFYYMAEDAPRKPFTYNVLGVGYSYTINP